MRVQQDGARPHTGKNVVDRLNAIYATLMPRITVVTQPAHSPDMNVNDLGLFRALDVKVQRRSRSMKRGRMDPEQLAKDVEATYAAFDKETLEKVWKYKRYVMRCVKRQRVATPMSARHSTDTETDMSEPVV